MGQAHAAVTAKSISAFAIQSGSPIQSSAICSRICHVRQKIQLTLAVSTNLSFVWISSNVQVILSRYMQPRCILHLCASGTPHSLRSFHTAFLIKSHPLTFRFVPFSNFFQNLFCAVMQLAHLYSTSPPIIVPPLTSVSYPLTLHIIPRHPPHPPTPVLLHPLTRYSVTIVSWPPPRNFNWIAPDHVYPTTNSEHQQPLHLRHATFSFYAAIASPVFYSRFIFQS